LTVEFPRGGGAPQQQRNLATRANGTMLEKVLRANGTYVLEKVFFVIVIRQRFNRRTEENLRVRNTYATLIE